MPVLEINEDEKKLLLIALVHDRVRLMHEWAQISDDDGRIDPDGDRWVIDGVVDAMTDLRRKIEAANDAPKAAWHHKHGWLHPKKAMEAAEAAVEAGEITLEEVAADLGFDLAEVDADNARDRARQDQMSPGTWTTLPEDFEGAFEDTDFDAERGDSRARGFTALLFQDFSVASDADVKNALALVRERPAVITALKGNLDRIAEMSAVVS